MSLQSCPFLLHAMLLPVSRCGKRDVTRGRCTGKGIAAWVNILEFFSKMSGENDLREKEAAFIIIKTFKKGRV